MENSNDTVACAPSGFFVLRTPLLPFDEFLRWSESLCAPSQIQENDEQLNEAIAKDRAELRRRLREVCTRREVRDALFVASPDLDASLNVWEREPESARGQRLERALVRYFSRMTGRATPFGLLAGCSVGDIQAQTRLILEDMGSYRRHTRLDLGYLVSLTDALSQNLSLRQHLRFRPNNSLFSFAGRAHYVEAKLKDRARAHNLVAIDSNRYLEAVLQRAQSGESPATLAETITQSDPDISHDEAKTYINALIDNQALLTDLEPPVTGADPIKALIMSLDGQPDGSRTAQRLETSREQLAAIDGAGVGVPTERYREIAQYFADLPVKAELPRLFQVDMFKPAPAASLGKAPVREILKAVEVLHRLSWRRDEALKQFRQRFEERYENREVPLAEALDEEAGIGFGPSREVAPLLEGLVFLEVNDDEQNVPWNNSLTLLRKKVSDALLSGDHEIRLSEDDLQALEGENRLPLADAFSVMATIASPSEAAIDRGDFILAIDNIVGPSGGRLLGRFCYADHTLDAFVRDHLRAEEALHPGAVFAEIVHLPQGRLGNILYRPVMREYEVPYLGRSGAPAEKQIPISDLTVSVRDGRIVLTSKRLGCEVIPRLTSAHNYNGAGILGQYRFLCALQNQGTASLGWDWGVLAGLRFVPRVTHGRLVLARASWRFITKELKEITETRGAQRFRAIQRLRAYHRLPRFLAIADGDNKLPIDLDNVLSVDTLVEIIKQRQAIRLVEMFLTGSDELCVRGPEGNFVNEIIVPFNRVRQPRRHALPPTVVPLLRERVFPPGSEWLYLKLYTGKATADKILRETIRPLTEELAASGAIDRWFFVRYGDPHWHLRLRFHGDSHRLISEALPALNQKISAWLDDGRVWRMQLDTYQREVERYGGLAGVICAEEIFHADSEATLSILRQLLGDEGSLRRWRLALRSVDQLLTDFGFDLQTKHALACVVTDSYARGYRGSKHLKRQAGQKYRGEAKNVAAIIEADADQDNVLRPGLAALRSRSELLGPVVSRLRALEQSGELTRPLNAIIAVYIHMQVNRIFQSSQKSFEFLIYDFLARYYQSEIMQAGTRTKLV
jgi:thiopeptide-type bacteriocin biosynthesis protein